MPCRSFHRLLSVGLIVFLMAFHGISLAAPTFQPDANMDRSDIPSVYCWDLTPLCASDAKWQEEMRGVQAAIQQLDDLQQDISTPHGLFKYLEIYFTTDDHINRLTLYANLKRDTDNTSQTVIANHNQALDLTAKVMEKGNILRQTILELSDQALHQSVKEEPGLESYLFYIDNLRKRADRVLSPKEERLLSMAGDNYWAQIDLNELPAPPEKTFTALIADMTLPEVTNANGEKVRLSFANYGLLRGSENRDVRRETVEAMFSTLKGLENTFAVTLGEQARFNVFLAKARGYNTALEAYLDRDQLTPDVYYNLIQTVHANLEPLHKYVDLRKKALKFDEIHLYDLYVPMVADASMEIDFNQAVDIIQKSLAPMGKDYVNPLKIAMDPKNGWVDVYPSQNKNSGAFSSSTYGHHPYVKMNYQNQFDDCSTLAHEYGHAMHSYYAMNQPYLSWRYSPFLAEIASTCNEALLSSYMIQNARSKKEKAWLITELLETIRTTIYRQTLFAEFELRVHALAEAGEPINAEKLNAIYANLIRDYYGPGYTMDANDCVEWAYIPHFYYKYYVFTYATGLSSGIAFAEKIKQGDVKTREAYLNMLKGGCSEPPLVLLQKAGLDLTKPEAIASALKLFDRSLDELNQLLD